MAQSSVSPTKYILLTHSIKPDSRKQGNKVRKILYLTFHYDLDLQALQGTIEERNKRGQKNAAIAAAQKNSLLKKLLSLIFCPAHTRARVHMCVCTGN